MLYKKINNSKKGLVFTPLTVFIVWFVLLFALNQLEERYDKMGASIGQRQADILNTYQSGELALWFVDDSARISSFQAAYDLGQNGGFFSGGCGPYLDYIFWYNQGKECYPINIKTNFYESFNKSFTKLLAVYNNESYFNISLDGYDFLVYDNQIIGIPADIIRIPIYQQIKTSSSETLIGNYGVKPSFSIPFDFDFSVYYSAIDRAKELVNSCSSEENPIECMNEVLANNGITNWKLTNPDSAKYNLVIDPKKIVFFEIMTSKKYTVYSENKFTEKEIIIRFGMHFSDTTKENSEG